MLTQEQFERFKDDYPVYGKVTIVGRYGNVKEGVLADTPKATIHVMWNPVTDEASIAEYGERVAKMLQAVVYGDAELAELDVVAIRGENYEIRSIQPYNTHRLIRVEKV